MASSDKAQYAIDIAATMTGGAKTLSELDALTNELLGAGKNAEHFQEAIKLVTNQIDGAAEASKNANDALAAGTDVYKQLEKAALNASKAAERAALKNEGVIPKDLYDEVERAKAALDAEAVSLKKLETAAAEATGKHDKLKSTLKNLNDLNKHVAGRLGDATSKTSAFAGALGDLGGPLGGLGQRVLAPVKGFSELAEKFSLSTAVTAATVVGVVAVTAAVVALSAAAIAGVASIASWGVSLADAGRNAKLANEAFGSLSESNLVAVDTFRGVTAATGLGADKLRDLTRQLTAAKVSADDMPAALRAAATAEAALGQGGSAKFLEDLKKAKGEVGSLASEVQAKFGGVVSRQMLGLEAQGNRLKSNLGETFGGLDIEPLLEGLSVLVNLFDENTASGKALKFLFETILQPIIDALTRAIPLVEAFFLGLLIGAVKIYIALKPAIAAVSEFLGFNDETSAETFKSFAKAGEIVGYVIAALIASFTVIAAVVLPLFAVALGAVVLAVGVVAAVIAGLVVGAVYLGAKFVELVGVVAGAVASIYSAIVSGLQQAWDFLLGLGAQALTIGAQIMQGLAQGIMNGAGAVVSAISGAVKGAINAAKSLLGIASPSKVFGEIGGFTTEGYTNAVEAGAPDAQKAMAEVVAPPDPSVVPAPVVAPGASMIPGAAPASGVARVNSAADVAASGSAATAPSADTAKGGSGGVNLDGVTFNFYGVENGEAAEPALRKAFVDLLNGALREAGGAPA